MENFFGIVGIVLILTIAFFMSNNKKAINKKMVLTGLGVQVLLAIFILKVKLGQIIFAKVGYGITKILDYSDKGADFVFGIFPFINNWKRNFQNPKFK